MQISFILFVHTFLHSKISKKILMFALLYNLLFMSYHLLDINSLIDNLVLKPVQFMPNTFFEHSYIQIDFPLSVSMQLFGNIIIMCVFYVLLIKNFIIKSNEEARIMFMAISMIILASIHDALQTRGIIDTPLLVPFIFAIFLYSVTMFILHRHTQVYKEIEIHSNELEETVKQRTLELDSQLKSMQELSDVLLEARAELNEKNKALTEVAEIDYLTGIYNHRKFKAELTSLWNASIRSKKELSILMIDIDFFKQYNDTYGHQAGDDCLQKVAKVLTNTMQRPPDFVARYGGEEFSVVLFETDKEGAKKVASKLVENIQAAKIEHNGSKVSQFLSISIGIATVVPDKSSHFDEMIHQADLALYEAKEGGHNRFV
jgi:diguanylate cyclase (GGDEF)-like protein